METVISLIVATYGRKDELVNLFESIECQDYPMKYIEVIVIDQNELIILDDVIAKFENRVNIKHIKTSIKGLSVNRNIGLNAAIGDIVAFPDDDCKYYPETISSVVSIFNENKSIDILFGRIYDRKSQENIIRNWPKNKIKINLHNFYLLYSSITIFSRLRDIRFDESFGVGACYGSYEDADYVIQAIKNRRILLYYPSIVVWHPKQNIDYMNSSKVYAYGMGFGALCKKHLSLKILYLYVKVITYHSSMAIYSFARFDFEAVKKRVLAISGRITGFYEY